MASYRNLFQLGYGCDPDTAWSPLSLGSRLAAWYKADAGCYTDAACLFASGSSQYLSRSGSAVLRGAATGWWLSCWVYMNSAGVNFDVHGCVTAFTSGRLLRILSTGQVDLIACNAGAFAQATHTTNIGTGVWRFIYAQYDGANIGVSVDGGALQTAALASYVPGSNAFSVGNDTAINDFFDGGIGRFFGGDGTLSGAQITALYNAGAGLFYADLPADIRALTGFAFNLCESSSTRVDSVGGLNLTPTNGPTVAAGPGEGLAVNNSPVKRITDYSGNSRNLLQATIAAQPLWIASGQNGLPVVRFTLANSSTMKASYTLAQPADVFAAYAWTAQDYVMDGGSLHAMALLTNGADAQMYAGSFGPALTSPSTTFHVFRTLFSGAASVFSIDAGSDATGNPGTATTAGLTVGSSGTPGNYSSVDFGELLIGNAEIVPAAQPKAYLKGRWATP